MSFSEIITAIFNAGVLGVFIGSIAGAIIHGILEKFDIVKPAEKYLDYTSYPPESKSRYDKKEINRTVYGSILLVFVFFSIKFLNLGSTQIGNIFESEKYNEQYYVYLYPDKNGTKNYKVKADIYKNGRDYYLETAYFNNGGYITFDNYGYDDSLEVGEKIRVRDDEDKVWYIELSKQRVNE